LYFILFLDKSGGSGENMEGSSMKYKLILILLSFLAVSCGINPSGSIKGPGSSELTDLGTPPSRSAMDDPVPVELPDLGPAPELSNQVWINTDQPLRLADLRGKVVLLEMWTFG
jgi:hypothetical protein